MKGTGVSKLKTLGDIVHPVTKCITWNGDGMGLE